MFDYVKPISDYEGEVPRKTRSKGAGYPVDEDWRNRVKETLRANLDAGGDPGRGNRGPRNRAELARESGLSRSTITDLLNGNTNQCVGLPAIHKALGWLPPYAALSGLEELLVKTVRQLEEFGQGRLLEKAISLVNEQNVKSGGTAKLPGKKKTKPFTTAGLSLGELGRALHDADREGDELPHEAPARRKAR